MIIEHDPDETPRKSNAHVYWAVWAIVALLWFGQWYYDGLDWEPIALGLITGCVLAGWAIEITGNKLPESWRRKPPR